MVAQGQVYGHAGGADGLSQVQEHGVIGRMALAEGRVAGHDGGGGLRIQGEDSARACRKFSAGFTPR